MKTYQIYLKHVDDSLSVLTYRNRTSWGLRTAKKHLNDLIREKLNSDKWVNVRYFSLQGA